jgi:hypothetical protein
VGLGGEVHDCVTTTDRIGDRDGVLDRPSHKANFVDHAIEVLPPSRVCELVEHGHLVAVIGQP